MQSLLFVLGLLFIMFIGYVLCTKFEKVDIVGIVLIAISVFILAGFLMGIPVVRLDENSKIKAYYAFEETLEMARSSEIGEVERASLTVKIAEWNEYIAKIQYQNDTVLDWWIPDEAMELAPIK